jgi:hypothetical protein
MFAKTSAERPILNWWQAKITAPRRQNVREKAENIDTPGRQVKTRHVMWRDFSLTNGEKMVKYNMIKHI